MLSENFIWLALLITIGGNLFYLRDTLKGETQPNRVTFFLWGAAPLVGYFAQRTEGGGKQIIYTLLVALVPLVIFAASFIDKKAYWAITRFDVACGLLSVIALAFLFASNGMVALIISIVADFFAALPTLLKSYKFPQTETAITYAIELFGSIIVLLTVKQWVFVNYSFVAYIVLMNAIFTLLLLYPRKKTGAKPQRA